MYEFCLNDIKFYVIFFKIFSLVLVYRCQGMAQNCGICLELPDKYACGWCQDPPSSCQVHEQCSADPTQWLDHSQTCPDPKITRVCQILSNCIL